MRTRSMVRAKSDGNFFQRTKCLSINLIQGLWMIIRDSTSLIIKTTNTTSMKYHFNGIPVPWKNYQYHFHGIPPPPSSLSASLPNHHTNKLQWTQPQIRNSYVTIMLHKQFSNKEVIFFSSKISICMFTWTKVVKDFNYKVVNIGTNFTFFVHKYCKYFYYICSCLLLIRTLGSFYL